MATWDTAGEAEDMTERRNRPEIQWARERINAGDRLMFRADAGLDGPRIAVLVPQLGLATQARALGQVEILAREMIATELGVPPYSFDLDIVPAEMPADAPA
jgi:hypothetical protein